MLLTFMSQGMQQTDAKVAVLTEDVSQLKQTDDLLVQFSEDISGALSSQKDRISQLEREVGRLRDELEQERLMARKMKSQLQLALLGGWVDELPELPSVQTSPFDELFLHNNQDLATLQDYLEFYVKKIWGQSSKYRTFAEKWHIASRLLNLIRNDEHYMALLRFTTEGLSNPFLLMQGKHILSNAHELCRDFDPKQVESVLDQIIRDNCTITCVGFLQLFGFTLPPEHIARTSFAGHQSNSTTLTIRTFSNILRPDNQLKSPLNPALFEHPTPPSPTIPSDIMDEMINLAKAICQNSNLMWLGGVIQSTLSPSP
jgi:hypothetical protein